MCGILAFMRQDFLSARNLLDRVVAQQPDHAEALKFLAVVMHRLGHDVEALAIARRAIARSPNDAQVANTLGVLLMNLEQYDEAADHLNRALELAPKDPAPLINLAVLESRGRVHRRRDSSSPKAKQVQKQALRTLLGAMSKSALSPPDAKILTAIAGNSPAHFNAALAAAEQLYAAVPLDHDAAGLAGDVFARNGDITRAIEMREYAAEGAPSQSNLRGSLGQLLIAAGDKRWKEGWEIADQDFLNKQRGRVLGDIPTWTGERLKGKRLLVYQDQGFGDVLLGLRLLRTATARGIKVVFWVAPPMGATLSQVQGYWDELIVADDRPDVIAKNCGAVAPLFSLIRLLNLRPGDLKAPANIHADPAKAAVWADKLLALPGRRVGLAATGNPWRQDDWFRSVPLSALKALGSVPDVSWVNLSVDARPERDQATELLKMADPTPELRDFADTAALIANLDAVVAIDCSVAHLSCALGKPTFVLVPAAIDWRWQIGDDTNPWWPCAQTFRAERPGSWDKSIANLREALVSSVQSRP